jgi:competence protein ComEC
MKEYPFIKVAIFFVAGILSAQFFAISFVILVVTFVALCIVLLFYNRFISSKIYTLSTFVLIAILLLSVGNVLAQKNINPINPALTEINKVKNTTAFGEISNIDLIRNDQLIFYLNVDSMYSDEFLIVDELNILCKVKTGKRALKKLYNELKPGNEIKVTGFYHKGKERRNPGEFDYNAYLNSKDILGIINIDGSKSISVLNPETNVLKNIIFQARVSIDNRLKEYYSPETAALLRGLLLADRGEINYETKTEFINAGVVHVLAVSGLHVGYIILIFLFLFGRFNIYLRSILTIVGLFCFMLITGVPPSVFRATVMATVLIIAFMANRSTNLLNSISIAAVIILIINPNELFNPGFQLSFSAVLAIGIILPHLNELINSWNIRNKPFRYIILFSAVSLSAQIGTLPFTLLYFNKFSVIALFTNLIVIPAIGVIISSAIVMLVFSIVLPPLVIYLAAFNDLLTSGVLSLIKFSGNLSFSYLSITDYSIVDLLIFYLMLSLLLYFLPKFNSIKSKVALLILVVGNTLIYSTVDDIKLLPDNKLSVLMIDVNQGDSFLIKFPNGKTALVDAGNATNFFDNGERVIIPLLNYLGIHKVDYGIISHIDSDHYGGFVSLVMADKIGTIVKPPIDTSLSKDRKFEEFIRQNDVTVEYFKEEKMKIGNTAIYFLFDKNLKALSGKSTNDRSGFFKLVYGNTSFLFTGDLEKRMEKFYSSKYRNFLDSDVLKVGHHGSKTSSSQIFLEYVTPELSLISAGFKNKFGHPSKEIVERLKNTGSSIYRTDLNKAVLLISDGENITVINWKK